MFFHFEPSRHLLAQRLGILGTTLLAQVAIGLGAQAVHTDPGAPVFVRPARRAAEIAPTPLRELPPEADHVRPLTLDVAIRTTHGAGTDTVRQTVSRTRDRVHLVVAGREWLFERNPLDRRRVSGWLVEHAGKTIVLHEESDLRHRLDLNGWADVLMLGFDSRALSGLTATGQAKTIAGIRFRKFIAPDQASAVSEVWWSAEQALPSALVSRAPTGQTHVSVEHVRAGVDPERLRSPLLRFPAYQVLDLAGWLEGH